MRTDTVTLIGMPGAGKSSVGVLLAKQLGLKFVDSDLDIQVQENASLQQILDRKGHLELRRIEQTVLLQLPLARSLIATGGSVIYSDAAMSRLAAAGPVVYIAVDLAVLEQRVDNRGSRGIASDTAQSFADIYRERIPLYASWASLTVDGGSAPTELVARRIAAELASA